MKKLNLFFLAPLLLLFMGCPVPQVEDKGTLELKFELKINGSDGELGQNFQIFNNRYLNPDSIRFYISNAVAVKADGGEVALAEVALFDFDKTNKTTHGPGIFEAYAIPVGQYKGIKFNLGLPSTLNHTDPASYTNDSDLHASHLTHWNNTDGYYFLQIAGLADSVVTGGTPLKMSYQIGLDNLMRAKDYSTGTSHAFSIVAKSETQFVIQMELTEILSGIDFVRNPINHTRPQGSAEYDKALIIMNQFVNNSLYKVP